LKGKKRHDFIYRILCILLRSFIARKFNFYYDKIKPIKPPYIVISNHLTNWDPLFIGISFARNMYYVATDQVLRMGLKSRILDFFFAPIPRVKTMQETQTVISIFRRLKEKGNVCIFAEGNASYDGETCEVQPSIGKLIKRAGVSLVTYRFTGSYFTFPRWARFMRRGKMEGRLIQIYNPEKIASMSEGEIYKAIIKDISVSAYAQQEKAPAAFHGKKRAEYLETVLYCCPNCRRIGTLKSCDDELSCSCGFKTRYSEYCYFEGAVLFKTITEWAAWQKKEIEALALKLKNYDSNTAVFSDDSQSLYEAVRATSTTLIAEGKLSLFKDRLSLAANEGTYDFPFEKIADMSGFAMTRIVFSTNDHKLYEIHSRHPRSALKYLDIFNAVKNH